MTIYEAHRRSSETKRTRKTRRIFFKKIESKYMLQTIRNTRCRIRFKQNIAILMNKIETPSKIGREPTNYGSHWKGRNRLSDLTRRRKLSLPSIKQPEYLILTEFRRERSKVAILLDVKSSISKSKTEMKETVPNE